MAVVHVAFQFNPSDYYKELLNRMFTDGSWNPDNARILARSIVSEATSEEEETLLYFRFDHSWLPYEAIEGSTPTDWAVLFLTKMLTKSPSLSNRFMGSYAILKTLLPLAGWSPEEINMLLTGRNLNTLIEASGNDILINNITGLQQYGGWLEVADIQNLLEQFLKTEDLFCSPPSSTLTEIAHFASLWHIEPQTLVRLAYLDGFDMLNTATQSEKDLILVLD
jgi:hypothetical protein